MMTKTVHTKILVRCDVGLCDPGYSGPIFAIKNGDDPGLLLAELKGAGWLLGDLDACPSCADQMQARRGEPMEDPDGA